MTDQTPEALIAKARERAERPCVWSEGEVPRHVAEYLWDAVYDRHALLAYIDTLAADLALGATVRREGLRFDAEDIRTALRVLGPTGTRDEAIIAVAAQTLADALDAAKEAERE